jgi:hypothetical protein
MAKQKARKRAKPAKKSKQSVAKLTEAEVRAHSRVGIHQPADSAVITIELLKPEPAGWRVRIDGKLHEPDLLAIVMDRIAQAILQRCT